MKLHAKGLMAGAVVAMATLAACGFVSNPGVNAEDTGAITKAVCVLTSTEGNAVHGTVTFTQQADGVLIEAHVMGLAPNSKHGFHIHEFGDISKSDGTAAGGHFNPGGHEHGAPDGAKRHVGDLGNIEADAGGHAMYKRVDKVVELNGVNCILGRGLIVHAGTDDLKTQPTGDAGARVAMGVIGAAKP
jgi:Cu-Zn family superoxide dismutase